MGNPNSDRAESRHPAGEQAEQPFVALDLLKEQGGVSTKSALVNQWYVDRHGSDRDTLRMNSVVNLSERDVRGQNPEVDLSALPTGEKLRVKHSNGIVEGGWSVAGVNRDGTWRLEKTLTKEVATNDDHDGLLESTAGVSPEYRAKLESKLAQLDRLQPGVLQNLRDHGYKIFAVPSIPESFPLYQGATPRGWPRDTTFRNSDGTQDEIARMIIAPELCVYDDIPEQIPDRRSEVIVHQIGHALDHANNDLSAEPAFEDAYTKDIARIKTTAPDLKPEVVRYLSQPDGVGRRETFATVFGLITTGPENADQRQALERAFPNTMAVVRKQIEDITKK